ncbi:uncharacterized protein BDV14DRAFT_205015 [Aspergillus stella-maris]|uniref:uncharacterized protein n=1 Tax=Aspergillus stella-maris TaxID=1810926 RepID=UPI003CCCD109
MLNGLQALTTFKDFIHPTVAIAGLINSSYWVGSIVAFPIAPAIANKWGRRWAIILASLVMFVAAVVQRAAQNVGMFAVARILFGLSASTVGNCGPVLVAELAHLRDREFLTALYNGLYYVGAIMAAWVTYGTFPLASTYGWRIPSYLQGAVAQINFSFIIWCQESLRFLIAQGRRDEAHAILAIAHSNGDLHDPVVLAEMEEISLALQRKTINKSSWSEFFTSPIYVVWLAVEFVIVFFTFPETPEYALEEVTAVLDNNPFLSFKRQPKHRQALPRLDEENVASGQVGVVEGGNTGVSSIATSA